MLCHFLLSDCKYFVFSARAVGGPAAAALQSEINRLRNVPLDEGPGEGYHRQSHLTLMRAVASAVCWAMASVRHKQPLDVVRGILSTYGAEAARVWRFEWQNYKRVLQTTHKYRWRPVRMTDAAFYRKLYRLDPVKDEDNWDLAFSGIGSSPDSRPADDSTGAIKLNYFQATFKEESFYSYTREHTELDADGQPKVSEELVVFQIIAVISSSQGRMKRIKTAHEEDDVISTARCAVSVQYLAKWSAGTNVITCFSMRSHFTSTCMIWYHSKLLLTS